MDFFAARGALVQSNAPPTNVATTRSLSMSAMQTNVPGSIAVEYRPMRNEFSDLAATAKLSDEELVARVRVGDRALYEILMHRYHRRLYGIVHRILRNDAETEEAMQEGHMHALENIGKFAGRSSFLTWLARIMTNEALSHLRQRRRFSEFKVLSATDCSDGLVFLTARCPYSHDRRRQKS